MTQASTIPDGAGGAARRGEPAVVIRPPAGLSLTPLREFWRYRELLYFLVWRDIKVRYKQTVIGAAWAILQPFVKMVVFSVIFGALLNVPSEDVPYPLFVYAGLLPWTFFSTAVTQSSLSLIGQARLLTKVYFPRVFIPAASVGVGVVDFAMSFVVYAGLMLWFSFTPGPQIVLLPALLLLAAVAALGTGLLLSSFTVVYRDVRIVVPFLIQIWMYVSPVIYPVTIVPQQVRWLMLLNPMTGIIDGFRSVLLDRPLDGMSLAVAAVMSLLVLVIGIVNFGRMEKRFADIV